MSLALVWTPVLVIAHRIAAAMLILGRRPDQLHTSEPIPSHMKAMGPQAKLPQPGSWAGSGLPFFEPWLPFSGGFHLATTGGWYPGRSISHSMPPSPARRPLALSPKGWRYLGVSVVGTPCFGRKGKPKGNPKPATGNWQVWKTYFNLTFCFMKSPQKPLVRILFLAPTQAGCSWFWA